MAARNADRRVWVFREACGCAFGVLNVDREAETRSQAWREFFFGAKERNAAMDRGVTVEEVDFKTYEAEFLPMMLGAVACAHRPDGA